MKTTALSWCPSPAHNWQGQLTTILISPCAYKEHNQTKYYCHLLLHTYIYNHPFTMSDFGLYIFICHSFRRQVFLLVLRAALAQQVKTVAAQPSPQAESFKGVLPDPTLKPFKNIMLERELYFTTLNLHKRLE